MDVAECLIWLCGQAVHEQVPEKECLLTADLEALYELASKHMLAAIVGMALHGIGIDPPKFQKAVQIAQYKALIADAERQRISQKLDELEIWYVPLKGAELKKYYPRSWMRESADLDILFDARQEEKVKELMLAQGYQCTEYGTGHHDVYEKASGICVEMHVSLFGVEYDDYLNHYFGNVKERLIREDGWEYRFTPEDAYLYATAHNYNHYVNSGVGFRALLDTYLFLKKHEDFMDWTYLKEELGKLGVTEFESKFRRLAQKCFGEGDAAEQGSLAAVFSKKSLNEDERKMFEYLAASGSHGRVSNRVENWIREGGGGFKGRVKYVWRRIFLPMDVVEHWFPFFYRHKILLPLLPLYRTYKGITGNKKKISAEWKAFRRR